MQTLLVEFRHLLPVLKRRAAGRRLLPDGKGGTRNCTHCKADYELIIGAESRDRFMQEIGFITETKNQQVSRVATERHSSAYSEQFVSAIAEYRACRA